MMNNYSIFPIFLTFLGLSNCYSVLDTSGADAIRCYSCSSLGGGHCSQEEFGEEKQCQPGYGCLIFMESKPGKEDSYLRDCLPTEENENSCKAEEGAEDGVTAVTCSCSTNLCNKNWVEAGYTDHPAFTTEVPSDPIMCFECDSSEEGHCTEDIPGQEKQCEPGHGCMITLETKVGKDDILIRDCSEEYGNAKFDCNTINGEDATLKTCNCQTALCNRNWEEAGSTDSPTDTPTEPADKTVKCYSCDSLNGECDDDHAGTETECAVDQGCNISKNKELYTRGCSVNFEPGCTEDADTRSCNCITELCNFDWKTAGAEDKIKCYSCDSHDGECDESHARTEIDCSVEAGCAISTDVFDGKTLFVRGCSGELEEQGCTNDDNATTCICLEPLCNFDWTTAGSTTASADTTQTAETTQEGSVIKCYSCSSLDGGNCSEEEVGEEMQCQPGFGCLISKETKPGEDDFYLRDCLPGAETENTCKTDEGSEEGVILQTCSCSSNLCNKNWVEAGSTDHPVDTTEVPSDPIKCFECDSSGERQCTNEYPGHSKECEPGHGCMITLETKVGKDNVLIRDCSEEYGNADFDCSFINGEDATIKTCNCKTPLCNRNWEEAGSTTASSDTTKPADTTTKGPSIKCYKCDSTRGDCSEEARGEETECPETTGCTIRKTTGKDGDVVMTRDCSAEKDALCDTLDNGDEGTTQFCNCPTPLCNGDWTSAGSTDVPPHTDKTTTHTHTEPPTPAPGAASKMYPAMPVALGAVLAMLSHI